MRPNPQETADLIIFTEEILNGKLHFFMQFPFIIIFYCQRKSSSKDILNHEKAYLWAFN